MADKNNKNAKNIAGPFYVDAECIGCGMCKELAEGFFEIDDSNGVAYVAKQPSDDEGTAKCAEAMSSCPVDAIGNDGE